MGMTVFCVGASILYLMEMAALADELRDLSGQRRKEAQTIPMMLAVTVFYGVTMVRLPMLIACFAGG